MVFADLYKKSWVQSFYTAMLAWVTAYLPIVASSAADPDLWGRFSIAALYFQNGLFPKSDVFSYTAPHAQWFDHEWLTGMLFYIVMRSGGELGLALLKAGAFFLVLYGISLLHRTIYRARSQWLFYGGGLLLSLYGMGFYASIRSQVISFVFFTLFILILERGRRRQTEKQLGQLLLLLPLGVIWGNCHGGVAMGLLLLLIYGVTEIVISRKWQAGVPYTLVAMGIFGLLGLLNPYGLAYLPFLIKAWVWDRHYIGEWDTLRFGWALFWELQVVVLMVGLLLVGQMARLAQSNPEQRKQVLQTELAPWLVTVLLSAMAVKSLRFQSFLAFGLLAYAPVLLTPFFQSLPQQRKIDGWIQSGLIKTGLPLLLAMSSLGGLFYLNQYGQVLKIPVHDEWAQAVGQMHFTRYPVGAIEYLRQSPYKGNLMVRFGLGEFTYWCLYPRFKVSMDGRYEEVYTQAQFLKNYDFYNRYNPKQAIDAAQSVHHTQADFILLENNMPNADTMAHSKHWQSLYSDPYFTVWGRKHFKPYQGHTAKTLGKMLSVSNFFTTADLNRFQSKSQ